MSAGQFDAAAHLARLGWGQNGGGDGGGEATTADSLTIKGIDKAVQTTIKIASVVLPVPINAEIEGKGIIAAEANVGQSMALSGLAVLKDTHGGIIAKMLKYFTREIDYLLGTNLSGGEGGHGGGESGGGGDEGSHHATGGGDMGGHGGGGDFHGHGGGHDAGEMINYGGKMVSAEALNVDMASLGNFSPPTTPTSTEVAMARGGSGMEM
jgi:hypothetical protein